MRPLRCAPVLLAAAVAVVAAGVSALVGGAAAGRDAATPTVAGLWQGKDRIRITGTLAGGFTLRWADPWTFYGCVVDAGQVAGAFTPAGGGSYTLRGFRVSASAELKPGAVQKCAYALVDGGTATARLDGPDALVIEGCSYSFCTTLQRIVARPKAPATTTRPAATTTTPRPARDTSRPVVQALGSTVLGKPGTRIRLPFTVADDSGRAWWHATLYDQGVPVKKFESKGQLSARGQEQSWLASLEHTMRGPLFYCVWAEDAAGNRSADSPRSSCGWLSLLVDLHDRTVSNGCGGAQWGAAFASVQNFLLDTQTYGDYTVSFREACNVHDAGYAGVTVWDPINRRYTDFRTWTRALVDAKFLRDIGTLCAAAIPATAALELATCQGGPTVEQVVAAYTSPKAIAGLPIPMHAGAQTYCEGVRTYAGAAFDAEAGRPGIQTVLAPAAKPDGSGRDNR